MGLIAPAFRCLRHAGDGVICHIISIHHTIDVGGAVRDPMTGIRGQEERHANLNDGGVGGVLQEGGVVHGVGLN